MSSETKRSLAELAESVMDGLLVAVSGRVAENLIQPMIFLELPDGKWLPWQYPLIDGPDKALSQQFAAMSTRVLVHELKCPRVVQAMEAWIVIGEEAEGFLSDHPNRIEVMHVAAETAKERHLIQAEIVRGPSGVSLKVNDDWTMKKTAADPDWAAGRMEQFYVAPPAQAISELRGLVDEYVSVTKDLQLVGEDGLIMFINTEL